MADNIGHHGAYMDFPGFSAWRILDHVGDVQFLDNNLLGQAIMPKVTRSYLDV
jgi:hypothetical protein